MINEKQKVAALHRIKKKVQQRSQSKSVFALNKSWFRTSGDFCFA
jgi:hypothetical protein